MIFCELSKSVTAEKLSHFWSPRIKESRAKSDHLSSTCFASGYAAVGSRTPRGFVAFCKVVRPLNGLTNEQSKETRVADPDVTHSTVRENCSKRFALSSRRACYIEVNCWAEYSGVNAIVSRASRVRSTVQWKAQLLASHKSLQTFRWHGEIPQQ